MNLVILGETTALNGHTDPELVKEVAELKSQLGNAKETIANLEGAESELSELKTKYDALIEQLKSVKQNTSANVGFVYSPTHGRI